MLDKSSPKPLYAQLEDIIRKRISDGEWKVNHAIPSELEFSKMYDVSRMTIRAVITRLVSDGLLYRSQGKGTFVAEPKISAQSLAHVGLREQLEQLGYTSTTQLISFFEQKADEPIAAALHVAIDTPVLFIERVRSIDDTPISLHRSYIPKDLVPNLNSTLMETEQLCVIVEKQFGLKAAHVTETLESVLATREEANLLRINRSHPLLLLVDINRLSSGTIFEFSKVLFRGDKFKLHFEYAITE